MNKSKRSERFYRYDHRSKGATARLCVKLDVVFVEDHRFIIALITCKFLEGK
jgi:hypothetical protein